MRPLIRQPRSSGQAFGHRRREPAASRRPELRLDPQRVDQRRPGDRRGAHLGQHGRVPPTPGIGVHEEVLRQRQGDGRIGLADGDDQLGR